MLCRDHRRSCGESLTSTNGRLWPNFTWEASWPSGPPSRSQPHTRAGCSGRMEALGFELRSEASLPVLTSEVVKSSAIEGEMLNPGGRSSIARKLGLDVAGLPEPSRDVDGIVEMMLDATREFRCAASPHERLFDWHSALFPTGRSGMQRITVGAWRTSRTLDRCRSSRARIGHEDRSLRGAACRSPRVGNAAVHDWFNGQLDDRSPCSRPRSRTSGS